MYATRALHAIPDSCSVGRTLPVSLVVQRLLLEEICCVDSLAAGHVCPVDASVTHDRLKPLHECGMVLSGPLQIILSQFKVLRRLLLAHDGCRWDLVHEERWICESGYLAHAPVVNQVGQRVLCVLV